MERTISLVSARKVSRKHNVLIEREIATASCGSLAMTGIEVVITQFKPTIPISVNARSEAIAQHTLEYEGAQPPCKGQSPANPAEVIKMQNVLI